MPSGSRIPDIERAVAGGVTTLQVLPGSGNLIGGRSVTLKLRPATTARAMHFAGAPDGLKMACGENPKRVYGAASRRPMTRMGNVALQRAAFLQATPPHRQWDQLARSRGEAPAPCRRRRQRKCAADTPATRVAARRLPRGVGAPERVRRLGEDMAPRAARAPGEHPRSRPSATSISRRSPRPSKGACSCTSTATAPTTWPTCSLWPTKSASRSAPSTTRSRPTRSATSSRERGIAVSTWADWWGFKLEAYDGIPENLALVDAGGRPRHRPLGLAARVSAGSTRRPPRACRRAGTHGIDVDDADALAGSRSIPPGRSASTDRVGSLEVGKDADVVVWDRQPVQRLRQRRARVRRRVSRYDRAKADAALERLRGDAMTICSAPRWPVKSLAAPSSAARLRPCAAAGVGDAGAGLAGGAPRCGARENRRSTTPSSRSSTAWWRRSGASPAAPSSTRRTR